MELILQPSLPHQKKAVDAVSEVFSGTESRKPVTLHANPEIVLYRDVIGNNVRHIQQANDIQQAYTGYIHDDKCLNIDVKMETGTGKTYVYTHAVYELHRRYGINKFIVAVPSLSIKAGTKQFMEEEYVKRHFRDVCGYDAEIELLTLEATKKKTKGRPAFPPAVKEFVAGSCQDVRKIYVLLVNMQLLKDSSNYALSRSYDQTVAGFTIPYDALRATRPFVIIDEPHRFSRDQKAFGIIKSKLSPQCIIRFGATFPETTIGKGKDKKTITEYQNLLYDLNACQAFNQGLIKGVVKEHFEPTSQKNGKIILISVKKNEQAVFRYVQADAQTRNYTLAPGDPLTQISDILTGITVLSIGKDNVELSNGQTKRVKDEMTVDVFMNSYQEQMLRLALERHFETERANFTGRKFRIKTLALFFIDDIASFTGSGGRDGWLLETFERLLKEKLQQTIDSLGKAESGYRKYLEASLRDIKACRAGYFAQDNSSSDEEIAKEIDDILRGKKRLLSFEDEDGQPMLRRFLFSKWTLKEGWDNPNVFTIAKLRSSGSEISKLQEVGRGLRLPVDECGNRISDTAFMLNYIVDFTERDFAEKLVAQVNKEVPSEVNLTFDYIREVAIKNKLDPKTLLKELLDKDYTDISVEGISIDPAFHQMFIDEYPFFRSGLDQGRILDRNIEQGKTVKIRKARFEELRSLWEILNRNYAITYEYSLNAEIGKGLDEILRKGGIFSDQVLSSHRDTIAGDGKRIYTSTDKGVQYIVNRPIPYGLFLKRVSQTTNIPVKTVHEALCRYVKKYGKIKNTLFNEQAVGLFGRAFADWKIKALQGRFRYLKAGNTPVGATALTKSDGYPKDVIAQGRIGSRIKEGTTPANYLYEEKAYDSPLELENIESDAGHDRIAEIVVYGKIPRKSIAIPTVGTGTYSPDFMYVIRKANGDKELNIVVETKDVKSLSDLRENERMKIDCAKVFFNNLEADGYPVRFHTQLSQDKMLNVIKNALDLR